MFDKKADTLVPINDLLASRWSGRAFDPARPVAHAQILTLLEAARWAPSCFGDQPWRYVICDRFANKVAWNQALSCLAEGNQTWAREAPVLMLSVADSIMSKTGKPNRWGQHDTGAASMSICVEATGQGLMVHQMGGFDADKARTLFAIPVQYTPMAMMSIGYQLPVEKIPEDIREREFAQRARDPLTQHFFDGVWEQPYSTK